MVRSKRSNRRPTNQSEGIMRLNLKPMQIDILKLYFKKLDEALGIEPTTPEHLKKSFNQKLDKLTKGKQ